MIAKVFAFTRQSVPLSCSARSGPLAILAIILYPPDINLKAVGIGETVSYFISLLLVALVAFGVRRHQAEKIFADKKGYGKSG